MLLQTRLSTWVGTIDDTYAPPGIPMLRQARLRETRL
jgi:hypothetical protein